MGFGVEGLFLTRKVRLYQIGKIPLIITVDSIDKIDETLLQIQAGTESADESNLASLSECIL